MKKQIIPISILFSAILLLGSFSTASAQSDKIIGASDKAIEVTYQLIIAQNDFPTQMNWADAKKACEALGEGWRLPTRDELNSMYINKNKIGGFRPSPYWSSTEIPPFAWNQYFNYGGRITDSKEHMNYVRAVRASN